MYVALGPRPEHGFDQPLGLLSDCHRRIEHFLRILCKIVETTDDGPLSDEQSRAVEAAPTYFETAGPRHTADEELSLFPLLRASQRLGAEAALATMKSLHIDHDAAEPAHHEIDNLYRKWMERRDLSPSDRAKLKHLLDGLHTMYERHLAVEDKELFPLAIQMSAMVSKNS
jgi:hemerythrin-like domain-containing protein